ncbi:hypothetical protein E2C01_003596 [Portunus trituberculatus]|uniref:Uncharacterized protein n=1 Tax=Portunus trituberculatus TaxID=210409 RepID=A0A5B7CMK1_PORTR|nr:hypothetical protein [Portunus trituberculatus]
MASTPRQARDFEGFVTTPRGLEKLVMDARIQALERLREKTKRNWQDRRDKEKDRIKSLLNKISVEEEGLYAGVEECVRLGAFEEDKNRPLKLKLKSQVAAEALLRRALKLKDSEETKTIYIEEICHRMNK